MIGHAESGGLTAVGRGERDDRVVEIRVALLDHADDRGQAHGHAELSLDELIEHRSALGGARVRLGDAGLNQLGHELDGLDVLGGVDRDRGGIAVSAAVGEQPHGGLCLRLFRAEGHSVAISVRGVHDGLCGGLQFRPGGGHAGSGGVEEIVVHEQSARGGDDGRPYCLPSMVAFCTNDSWKSAMVSAESTSSAV